MVATSKNDCAMVSIILWPICDILLSLFIFLFFGNFNSFLTFTDSYNKRIDSYNCRFACHKWISVTNGPRYNDQTIALWQLFYENFVKALQMNKFS